MPKVINQSDVKVVISKKLLEEIDLYFKSGNSVVPDRATIPFEKWEPIREEMKDSLRIRYIEKEV